jgi:hypothetical protein
LQTYQVRVSRLERINGHLQPEENLVLSIQREPKAVRLEWAAGPNQGREVIYAHRLDQRSLFVHQSSSAIPLPTIKVPVDSPMVMKNSRHSITEAGFDTIIDNLRKPLDRPDTPTPGRPELVYQGVESAPVLNRPAHRFTRRAPTAETWTIYLDAGTMLPCVVSAHDSHGQLVERYIYQDVRENPVELASNDAFDPNRRWGDSQGLLSRFARAAGGAIGTNSGQSTTR